VVVALQEEAVRSLAAEIPEAADQRREGALLEGAGRRPVGALQVAEGLRQVDVRRVVAVQRREEEGVHQAGAQLQAEEDRGRREADRHRVEEDLCRQRKTAITTTNHAELQEVSVICDCWSQGLGWHQSCLDSHGPGATLLWRRATARGSIQSGEVIHRRLQHT
jgi:hypothetical protein